MTLTLTDERPADCVAFEPRTLLRLIESVRPHMAVSGRGAELPLLQSILLETSSDGLRLVATDRYSLAVAHHRVPLGRGKKLVLIEARTVAHLRAWLRSLRGVGTVDLTLHTPISGLPTVELSWSRKTEDVTETRMTFAGIPLGVPPFPDYPDYRAPIQDHLATRTSSADTVSVDPRLLARLHPLGDAVDLSLGWHRNSVIATAEDWFVAVLMPLRQATPPNTVEVVTSVIGATEPLVVELPNHPTE